MRWIGIDEAGYGPNLGPLVMTSVITESLTPAANHQPPDRWPMPDLWQDLAATICRAGVNSKLLWVDDSKAILKGKSGRSRLEATFHAAMEAAGHPHGLPLDACLERLCVGGVEQAELNPWSLETAGPVTPQVQRANRPFEGKDCAWRITEIRVMVVGPRRFNERLDVLGSKALVHFEAFQSLLGHAWSLAADGRPTFMESDKHGGRHYYLGPLVKSFPDAWIDRGPEGPLLSQYTMRAEGRILRLNLTPRADAANGFVALASVVSKMIRELWMDRFNAFWTRRLPDLKPTAGYPVDATRFRRQIEALAQELGLAPEAWWRRK